MATHSSILAWRIPWTEKLGRLKAIGLHKSDRTEVTAHTHAHTHLLSTLFVTGAIPRAGKRILKNRKKKNKTLPSNYLMVGVSILCTDKCITCQV